MGLRPTVAEIPFVLILLHETDVVPELVEQLTELGKAASDGKLRVILSPLLIGALVTT